MRERAGQHRRVLLFLRGGLLEFFGISRKRRRYVSRLELSRQPACPSGVTASRHSLLE